MSNYAKKKEMAKAAAQWEAGNAEMKAQEEERPKVVHQEGNVGLGVDIVEIDRMAKVLSRTPAFAEKVFTQGERDYCNSKSNPATHFAARFAAKEAVSKALGTGLMVQGVRPELIEVKRDHRGHPAVVLHGAAKELADQQGVLDIPISLTYTHNVAVANVVVITQASQDAREKRRDIKAELNAKYKELRGMLDDLGSQTVQQVEATEVEPDPEGFQQISAVLDEE